MKGTALPLCSTAVRTPEPECAKQVADREAGVDCKRILKAAASSRSASATVKQRFREGSIDEVSFLGGYLQGLHPCSNPSPWSVLLQDHSCLGVRMRLCASIISILLHRVVRGSTCEPVALTQIAC